MSAVELEIPVADAEAAIGIPAKRWPGRCYGIAYALNHAGLVPGGRTVYGHYYGPVAPSSIFARSHGAMGWCSHGWVEAPGGVIVDPTRWVFLDVAPYIACLSRAIAASEYDEGGNRLRHAMLRPPPAHDPTESWDDLLGCLDDDAQYHVAGLLGTTGMVSFSQMMWLANAPLDLLGDHAHEVYTAIVALGQGALLPLDNRRRVLGDE